MDRLEWFYSQGILKVVLLDNTTIDMLHKIDSFIDSEKNIKSIAIDMTNIINLDNLELAEFISLKSRSQSEGFNIDVINASDTVKQIFDVTNLSTLFTFKIDFSAYSLDDLIRKFFDDLVATEVSDYLIENYNEDISLKLLQLLGTNDAVLIEHSILTMGRAQDFSKLEIFYNALHSEYSNVIRAAIYVLGWLGDTSSKDVIYKFLESSDKNLADAAAVSIALLSDSTDSTKLAKYLTYTDPNIRIVSAQALALINDEKSCKYLLEQFDKEEDLDVKGVLIKSLSAFKNINIAEKLIDLLDSEYIKIREIAAAALARLSSPEHIDKIIDKVTNTDSRIAFFATKALARSKNKEIASKLISSFDKVEQNVKLAILEVMGNLKYSDEKFLILKLDDSNDDIRSEALNSLYTLNPTLGLEYALKFYINDPSWVMRYKSIEIINIQKPYNYKKLINQAMLTENNKYVHSKLSQYIKEESL